MSTSRLRRRVLAPLVLSLGAAGLAAWTPGPVEADTTGAARAGQAPESASISGRVTDAEGRPVAGVSVGYAAISGRGKVSTSGSLSDVTDARGRWFLDGFVEGSYRVKFGKSPSSGPWMQQWWPGVPSYDLGTDIVLDDREQMTGVDAVVRRAGRIKGRLRAPAPLESASQLVLYRRTGGRWAPQYGAPAERGPFTLGSMTTGTYRVCLRHVADEANRECTGPVAVTQGRTSTTTLRVPSPGLVAGRVTLPVSDGAAPRQEDGLIITAYRRFPTDGTGVMSELRDFTAHELGAGRPRWEVVQSQYREVSDDEHIDYTMWDLPPGTYRFGFSQGTAETFWPRAPEIDAARDVVVAPGQDVTGLDAALDAGGSISGDLTGSDGEPSSANVYALRQDVRGHWRPVPGTASGGSGHFTLSHLQPGTYRIRFGEVPFDSAVRLSGNAVQYWPHEETLADAHDIVVPEDAAVTGIDAQLVREAGIRVTYGFPISGRNRAVAFRREGDRWVPVASHRYFPLRSVQYLEGLAPGRYRVAMIDLSGYWVTEFWEHSRTIENATDIVLEEGEVTPEVYIDVDPPVRNQVPASVRGKAVVGHTLRLRPGVWSPDDARVAVRWLADGKRIRGATGITYRVRGSDVGRRLSVRLVGTRPAYVTARVTTPRTSEVRR